MNESGRPSCCPLRTDLVFAYVLQTIKQTVARLLLLATCMGFGVVRPKLSKKQLTVLCALGGAYCGASLMNEWTYISGLNDTSVDTPHESTVWKLVEAGADATIIMAIYVALRSVSEELLSTGQTAKLDMYERLARALFAAIALFVIYSLAAIVVLKVKGDLVPWRLSVVFERESIWEVFFIIILVAIAFIWRPNESTARYSYSYQLPADVDDDDDEEEDDKDSSEDDDDRAEEDDDEDDEPFDMAEAMRMANGSDDDKAAAVGDVELTVLEVPHEGQEPVADVTLT